MASGNWSQSFRDASSYEKSCTQGYFPRWKLIVKLEKLSYYDHEPLDEALLSLYQKC